MRTNKISKIKRRGFLRTLGAGAATATLAACAMPAAPAKPAVPDATVKNKAVVQQFAEKINSKDLDGALALISPSYVEHSASPGQPAGPEGVRAWFTMLLAGMPDHKATIEDMIAEDDKVVARISAEGTQTGTFMGMPPTGKHVKYTFIDIHRLADGKLVEHWNETDTLGMMQQLGVIPPP